MINFTKINSDVFWEDKDPDVASFFEEVLTLENWISDEAELLPFLVFFEIQLNKFTPLSSIVFNDEQFQSLIEILAYLKIGTFFHWVYLINGDHPSFLISCLISCKQEDTVFERLFIERFQLLEKHYMLERIFDERKLCLIKTIISD